MSQTLSVKTEVFEGPLELLLELVERRKLLINDISLAAVTDEYLERVSEMQEKSLPNTVQFIQLAATLLLIKSKSLLPVLELTTEEEEGIDDLESRLQLYQIYRDAGRQLAARFGQAVSYGRRFVQSSEPLFVTDRYTTKEALVEAINRVLHDLPLSAPKPVARVRQTVTLEAMIGRLQQRVEREMHLRFSDLIGQKAERLDVIVGFLAVLESVKQGRVLAAQASHFGDIEIKKIQANLPAY